MQRRRRGGFDIMNMSIATKAFDGSLALACAGIIAYNTLSSSGIVEENQNLKELSFLGGDDIIVGGLVFATALLFFISSALEVRQNKIQQNGVHHNNAFTGLQDHDQYARIALGCILALGVYGIVAGALSLADVNFDQGYLPGNMGLNPELDATDWKPWTYFAVYTSLFLIAGYLLAVDKSGSEQQKSSNRSDSFANNDPGSVMTKLIPSAVGAWDVPNTNKEQKKPWYQRWR